MSDPEIMRRAARGDCIARAHDRISDIVPVGLDAAQRARVADVLAQVWDDGCAYGTLTSPKLDAVRDWAARCGTPYELAGILGEPPGH